LQLFNDKCCPFRAFCTGVPKQSARPKADFQRFRQLAYTKSPKIKIIEAQPSFAIPSQE